MLKGRKNQLEGWKRKVRTDLKKVPCEQRAELNHPLGAEESRQKLGELTARTVTAPVEKGRHEASEEVYDVRKNLNGKP